MQISGSQSFPTLTIGGRVFTDLSSNLIMLSGVVLNHTTSTLYKWTTAGNAAYQIPLAKSFYVSAIRCFTQIGALAQLTLGYADASVGQDTNTALTNAVGNQIGVLVPGTATQGATPETIFEASYEGFPLLAQKYPYITMSAANYLVINVWGYEK